MALLRLTLAFAGLAASGWLFAQEEPVAPEKVSEPPVRITFAPPDLDGRIVLGIFDAQGRLVRTLRPHPATPELKVDTNGYIAEWDGLDASGGRCPAGRYSARGYVVGDEVGIEGEAYHFNDWMAEDGLAVTAVRLCPWFGVELSILGQENPQAASIGADGTLKREDSAPSPGDSAVSLPAEDPPSLPVKPIYQTPGANGTQWVIFEDEGARVVSQIAADGEALREFREPAGEPQPVEVVASAEDNDSILLRETAEGGLVRVRLLKRRAASEGTDGRVTADWEVVFERSLQPCGDFGVKDGRLVASGGDAVPSTEVKLVANALEPGAKTLRVTAVKSGDGGSALAAPDGLGLFDVSVGGGWERFAVVPGAADGAVTLYQGNGAGVEEFSVKNLSQIAGYDAGSFLLGEPEQ